MENYIFNRKKSKKKVGIFSNLGRIRIRYFTKRIRGSGSRSTWNGSATLPEWIDFPSYIRKIYPEKHCRSIRVHQGVIIRLSNSYSYLYRIADPDSFGCPDQDPNPPKNIGKSCTIQKILQELSENMQFFQVEDAKNSIFSKSNQFKGINQVISFHFSNFGWNRNTGLNQYNSWRGLKALLVLPIFWWFLTVSSWKPYLYENFIILCRIFSYINIYRVFQ